MQNVMDWLANPMVKTALLFVGGFILKRWPEFVNKAIPVALLAISALLTLLRALFPDAVPADGAVAAVSQAAPWWKGFVVDVLVPTLLAVGAHSHAKNTREWWQAGARIWKAARG